MPFALQARFLNVFALFCLNEVTTSCDELIIYTRKRVAQCKDRQWHSAGAASNFASSNMENASKHKWEFSDKRLDMHSICRSRLASFPRQFALNIYEESRQARGIFREAKHAQKWLEINFPRIIRRKIRGERFEDRKNHVKSSPHCVVHFATLPNFRFVLAQLWKHFFVVFPARKWSK